MGTFFREKEIPAASQSIYQELTMYVSITV